MPTEIQRFFNDNITNDINDIKKNKHGLIYTLSMPLFNESSSEIRNRLKKNLDVKEFLPKTIQSYINQHGLYKLPGHNK